MNGATLTRLGGRNIALGVASLIVALAWAFVRVGPQTSTNLAADATRALGWPNPELDVLQSYNRTSPIGPLLFKSLPVESPGAYLALHVVAFLVALGLLALWVALLLPDSQKFRGARLVILGPAVASAFVSLGNYDPFTFLAVAVLLFAWRYAGRLALVAAGVLLGFQHFEQALFGVLALAIGVVALGSLLPDALRGRRQPAWALVGVVGGKLLLSAVLAIQGIDPFEGRSAYITDPFWLRQALTTSLNHFPTLLMSMFAGLWVVVALVFFRLQGRRARLLALLAVAGPVMVSVSTLAQTRVFVMTTLALLSVLVVVVLRDDTITRLPAVVLAVEACAWVLVPQHLYVSPGFGAHIMDTNALDYVIMFVNQIRQLA